MQKAQIPEKIQLAFAENADPALIRAIPVPSQIGITDGAASYNDGFPPLNATPPSAGGVNPSIEDFNGILNELSAMLRWYSAGGPIVYDSLFQTSIGGYPMGAIIASATTDGVFWESTADDNVTDPDAGGAGWKQAYEPPPGCVFSFSGSSIPTGYLQVPTTQTLVSAATYPALFAAIGYTWGGSGASFGLPYLASGYVPVQGTLAVLTHGVVKDHTHPAMGWASISGYTGTGVGAPQTVNTGTPNAPEGGPDNLAAGMGHNFIVKY